MPSLDHLDRRVRIANRTVEENLDCRIVVVADDDDAEQLIEWLIIDCVKIEYIFFLFFTYLI